MKKLEKYLTKKNKKFLEEALKIDEKLSVAFVYPHNKESILGAIMASSIIDPVLIGSFEEMKRMTRDLGYNISDYECFDVADETEASKRAVELAKDGKVGAIAKGSLSTDILLRPIISKEGLGSIRRVSNCYICDVSSYQKPIIYTDVGINVSPDVKIKKDIILNAIEVADAIGIKKPKIAILSCLEKVRDYIPSTVDAKELCDMKEEFGDVVMEGPLSFDIALSQKVAKDKGFKSEVAGDPDILIFPNLDSGNIAVKELEFFTEAQCGSLALGSKLPILINSRNTPAEERALSCIFAKLYNHRKKEKG